MIDIEATFI